MLFFFSLFDDESKSSFRTHAHTRTHTHKGDASKCMSDLKEVDFCVGSVLCPAEGKQVLECTGSKGASQWTSEDENRYTPSFPPPKKATALALSIIEVFENSRQDVYFWNVLCFMFYISESFQRAGMIGRSTQTNKMTAFQSFPLSCNRDMLFRFIFIKLSLPCCFLTFLQTCFIWNIYLLICLYKSGALSGLTAMGHAWWRASAVCTLSWAYPLTSLQRSMCASKKRKGSLLFWCMSIRGWWRHGLCSVCVSVSVSVSFTSMAFAQFFFLGPTWRSPFSFSFSFSFSFKPFYLVKNWTLLRGPKSSKLNLKKIKIEREMFSTLIQLKDKTLARTLNITMQPSWPFFFCNPSLTSQCTQVLWLKPVSKMFI